MRVWGEVRWLGCWACCCIDGGLGMFPFLVPICCPFRSDLLFPTRAGLGRWAVFRFAHIMPFLPSDHISFSIPVWFRCVFLFPSYIHSPLTYESSIRSCRVRSGSSKAKGGWCGELIFQITLVYVKLDTTFCAHAFVLGVSGLWSFALDLGSWFLDEET